MRLIKMGVVVMYYFCVLRILLLRISIAGLLIEEYLFLVDPVFRTSKSEAKRLLTTNKFCTFEEMLARIKDEKNLSPDCIGAIDETLARMAMINRSIIHHFKRWTKRNGEEIWNFYRTKRLNHFFKISGLPRPPHVLP